MYKNEEQHQLQKELTPKHVDFTNSVFNELTNFNTEEQVEILYSLYKKLEDGYNENIEINLKTAEDYKQRLSILKKLEPHKQQ